MRTSANRPVANSALMDWSTLPAIVGVADVEPEVGANRLGLDAAVADTRISRMTPALRLHRRRQKQHRLRMARARRQCRHRAPGWSASPPTCTCPCLAFFPSAFRFADPLSCTLPVGVGWAASHRRSHATCSRTPDNRPLFPGPARPERSTQSGILFNRSATDLGSGNITSRRREFQAVDQRCRNSTDSRQPAPDDAQIVPGREDHEHQHDRQSDAEADLLRPLAQRLAAHGLDRDRTKGDRRRATGSGTG